MITIKPLIISRTIPHLGGREVIVQNILEYFSKNNGATLITPDNTDDISNIYIIKYDEDKSSWNQKIQELDSVDFNVIHCHTFYMADFAIRISEYFKVPLVFTLHGVFFDQYDEQYKDIIQRIADGSTILNTVSKKSSIDVKKFLETGKNIDFVNNGIFCDIKINPFRKINTDKVIIAVPARLTNIKGLDYLIDAVPFFVGNIEIHICSPCGRDVNDEILYRNNLKAKIKSDNVFFNEFTHDQWLSFLNEVDIVLLPSLTEGQPLSILEAMIKNKIVIATNVGGIPEIIKNGINGFLIEPKSSLAISDSILKAMNLDEETQKNITNNARNIILEKFSFSDTMHSYLDLYEKGILMKQKLSLDVQAVIVDKIKGDVNFLILKRLNKNNNESEYRLVKGGVKKDEVKESALIREITEETGVEKSEVICSLSSYSYSYFFKRIYVTHNVSTYLVQTFSNTDYDKINQEEEGGFDIESVVLVNSHDVINLLTYEQERSLVKESFKYLDIK